jgi:hypothetical protein
VRDDCTSNSNKTASGVQKNQMSPHCGTSTLEMTLSKYINVSLEGCRLIADIIADILLAILLLISPVIC